MDASERQRLGKLFRLPKEMEVDREIQSEKELQKDVANLLRQRNIWFGASHMDKRSRFTMGAPDFLFVYLSRPFAFECKVGNNKPTEEQYRTHVQMRENGWLVFVVRSLEEAKMFLDGRPQPVEA